MRETRIAIEGKAWSDRTSAVRDTAEGSKSRTITGAIKGLFREAVKVLMRRNEAEPPPARRRSGETEGDFRRLARQIVRTVSKVGAAARGRYAALRGDAKPVQASAARENTISIPAEFFYGDPDWNVFDIANPLYDHGDSFDDGSDFDSGFDTESEHLSPGF